MGGFGESGWPPLPPSVMGPAGPVEVEVSAEIGHNGHMGVFRTAERKISIATGLKPEVAYYTLFHEVVELSLADSGLQNIICSKKQRGLKEAVCDAVALGMLAQFKHDRGL